MAEILGAISAVTGLLTTIEHVGMRIFSIINAKNDALKMQEGMQGLKGDLDGLLKVLSMAKGDQYLLHDEGFQQALEALSSAAGSFAEELADNIKLIEGARPGGESKHPHWDKIKRLLVWPWKSPELQQKILALPGRLSSKLLLAQTKLQVQKSILEAKKQQLEKKKEILGWLGGVEKCSPWPMMQRAVQARLKATTEWLFEHEKYVEWRNKKEFSLLWVNGMPGSGKTVIAGRLTEKMLEEAATSLGQDVCLYYFINSMASSVPEAEKMTTQMVNSFLFQLVTSHQDIPERFSVEVTNRMSASQPPSSFEAQWVLLMQWLVVCSSVSILVDGLDQLVVGKHTLDKLIGIRNDIIKMSGDNTKRVPSLSIFCTSRKIEPILSILSQHLTIDLDSEPGVKRDIASYVEHYIPARVSTTSEGTREKAATKIKMRAGAMFLWVRLMLGDSSNTGYLERTMDDAKILAAIDEFPDLVEYGERSLDNIYGTILSRLADLKPEKRFQARRILKWLISATSERPFRADELVVAAELTPKMKSLDMSQTSAPRAVISGLLSPLVTITENDSVSLVHLSVRQYLLQNPSPQPVNALISEEEKQEGNTGGAQRLQEHVLRREITSNLLLYFSLSNFSGFEPTETWYEFKVKGILESTEGALLEYATTYWALHAALLHEVDRTTDHGSDWGEEPLSNISSESVIGLEAAVLRYLLPFREKERMLEATKQAINVRKSALGSSHTAVQNTKLTLAYLLTYDEPADVWDYDLSRTEDFWTQPFAGGPYGPTSHKQGFATIHPNITAWADSVLAAAKVLSIPQTWRIRPIQHGLARVCLQMEGSNKYEAPQDTGLVARWLSALGFAKPRPSGVKLLEKAFDSSLKEISQSHPTSDTLELAMELAECYDRHKQPASAIVRPLQSALDGIEGSSWQFSYKAHQASQELAKYQLRKGERVAAAESLFRALEGIKDHTPPFPGHIYDTARQLSTLVNNQKDALTVIESVVRPENKDQNLFDVLCADSLTMLLEANCRIKEAIEFQERLVRDVKSFVRKSDSIQALLQLQRQTRRLAALYEKDGRYMEAARTVASVLGDTADELPSSGCMGAGIGGWFWWGARLLAFLFHFEELQAVAATLIPLFLSKYYQDQLEYAQGWEVCNTIKEYARLLAKADIRCRTIKDIPWWRGVTAGLRPSGFEEGLVFDGILYSGCQRYNREIPSFFEDTIQTTNRGELEGRAQERSKGITQQQQSEAVPQRQLIIAITDEAIDHLKGLITQGDNYTPFFFRVKIG
ncbi:hypothetical protein ACHAPM_011487 [Fusarium culmorum]